MKLRPACQALAGERFSLLLGPLRGGFGGGYVGSDEPGEFESTDEGEYLDRLAARVHIGVYLLAFLGRAEGGTDAVDGQLVVVSEYRPERAIVADVFGEEYRKQAHDLRVDGPAPHDAGDDVENLETRIGAVLPELVVLELVTVRQDRLEQFVLGPEVIDDRALRDADLDGDVGERGAPGPVAGQYPGRYLDDLTLARLAFGL